MENRGNNYNTEIEDKSCFVTDVDEIPIVWNFLLGLNRDDIIAEPVQNDLDREATRTIIQSEEDQLVSEGNGSPVDSKG